MNDEMENQINKIAERYSDPKERTAFVNTMGLLATIEHMERMEREATLLNNADEAQEEEEIHHEG